MLLSNGSGSDLVEFIFEVGDKERAAALFAEQVGNDELRTFATPSRTRSEDMLFLLLFGKGDDASVIAAKHELRRGGCAAHAYIQKGILRDVKRSGNESQWAATPQTKSAGLSPGRRISRPIGFRFLQVGIQLHRQQQQGHEDQEKPDARASQIGWALLVVGGGKKLRMMILSAPLLGG